MIKVSIKNIKIEYRPSGVDWLGNIPTGWNLVPTRSLFKTKKQLVGAEAEKHLLLGLTLSGVKPRDLSLGGKNPANYDGYQTFEPGELVMCLFDYDVTPRTVGYVKQKGMMTGAYTRLIPRVKLDARYYYYLFLYFDEKKELLHLCTGLRNSISKYVFWSLQNPQPSLETQKRIADFLDEKTKIIDDLMAKKEELPELLREKRAALITRAVTKGLEPNAKLKPSGIDWLGDIPEGWEIKPLKFYFSFEKGKNAQQYTKEYVATHIGEYPVYSGQTENEGVMGSIDTHDYNYPEVIFVTTVGAKAMTPILLRGKFNLSQNCLIMIPKRKIPISYFYYEMFPLFNFERASIPAHMQPSLRKSDLNQYKVVIPPAGEQKQITNFLDAETGRIDKAIALIESQIEKLKEYRSSLIYHAVTGKIKI